MNDKVKAAKLFELAATYALDGGLQDAIERATEGIAVLKLEQARRAELMQPTGSQRKRVKIIRA